MSRARQEDALRAIVGPEDQGPWIEVYRAAGGGYEGLQAIARAALDADFANPRGSASGSCADGPDGVGAQAEIAVESVPVVPVSLAAELAEALDRLVEAFDGFDDQGQERVMNEAMAWEDVQPRVTAARVSLDRWKEQT